MDSLIHFMNKIEEACAIAGDGYAQKLNLPQIVVVGAQSRGKSSVLESMVGKSFLPRGHGITTRRPLILKLIQTKDGTNDWAKFDHLTSQKFENFELVEQEMKKQNDLVAGEYGVSQDPIRLNIYSAKVPNLTLVDLPGVIENPRKDQPAKIDVVIRNMVLDHISKDNTIILAITPADDDIENSTAIKMAKQCDPKGDRTLVVLTKLDLVTNARQSYIRDVLMKKILEVRLGIIGVINRKDEDLISGKSIDDKKLEEDKFMRENYPDLAHMHGSKYLAERLSELLTRHINQCLPNIYDNLQKGIAENIAIKQGCGPVTEVTKKVEILIRAIKAFNDHLRNMLSGVGSAGEIKKLVGGAKIYELFFKTYQQKITSIMDKEYTDKEIYFAIRNANSTTSALFTPHEPFDKLAQEVIENIRTPSLQLVKDARQELDAIVEEVCEKSLQTWSNFPNLKNRIIQETNAFLEKKLAEAEEIINEHVDCEKAYVHTKHPLFKPYLEEYEKIAPKTSKFHTAKQAIPDVDPDGNIQQNDTMDDASDDEDFDLEDINTIRSAVKAQMTITKMTAIYIIPKKVMMHLVNQIDTSLEIYLLSELNDPATLELLLSEPPDIQMRRLQAEASIHAFEKAKVHLEEAKRQIQPKRQRQGKGIVPNFS